MREADLALVHAPSFLDFRERSFDFGPIADVIPSAPVFDMYPIGFLSLATYLARHGYKVRIMNLAARMLSDWSFDPVSALKSLKAKVYGIDLHWFPHCCGALDVARLIKLLHPEATVVLGGFTSSIFWREIVETYSFVDCVIVGDTAELPMLRLLKALDGAEKLEDVPNLVWRKKRSVKFNGLKFVPNSINEYAIDYEIIIKEAFKSRDWRSFLPFANFLKSPIAGVLAYKGCPFNCIICGGSRYSYGKYLGRSTLARKSAHALWGEISSLFKFIRKMTVFVLGDLCVLGKREVAKLVRLMREEKFDSPVMFEFYTVPPTEILRELRRASSDVYLQISPESHDESIRRAFGNARSYTNEHLTRFVDKVAKLQFSRLDLYFMVGLPAQTYESAVATPDFVDALLTRYSRKLQIEAFQAPLAPLLDPGSLAYDKPARFGYKLLCRGLSATRSLISGASSWREMLNYETKWMAREELVRATYDAALKMINVKVKHGLLDEASASELKEAIEAAELAPRLVNPRTMNKRKLALLSELYPTAGYVFRRVKMKLLLTFLKERLLP